MNLKGEGKGKKEEVTQGQKLPSTWIEVELGELAQIIRGVTYKKEQSRDTPHNGFLPVLRATNITGTALNFDGLVYVPSTSISSDQLLQFGDVVIASSSGSKEIVGKSGVFLLDGSFQGSFGAFCTGLRPSNYLAPAYFQYYFQTPSYRKSVSALSAGSNINNLKTGDLASQRFPLPPAEEQTRIVEKLEELLADLDAGVTELKTAQKKLAQYRQSLLKEAVEGQLTADWRAQNPPKETGAELLSRILKERRARWEAKQLEKFASQGKTPPQNWQSKYPEPVAPDTRTLSRLPEGWAWASVDQLVTLLSGHTPKDAGTKTTSQGDIHWFKVSDMNQDGNEEFLNSAQAKFDGHIASQLGLKIAPAGTIVFPKRGGAIFTNKKRRLGIAASYDLNMMGVIPVEAIADWLWWWFCMIDLGQLSDGSNVPQINNPDIAPLAVPIPPIAEQKQIMKCLVVQFAAMKDLAHETEVLLHQITAQRQNILRAAFAGELVPQDPNDEPASVLLARIRAQRAAQPPAKKPRKSRKPQETSKP